MTKKAIRKKIIEKSKKISKCFKCKGVNGVVKKLTASKSGGSAGGVLKIIHEKFRGRKERDPVLQATLGILFWKILINFTSFKCFS